MRLNCGMTQNDRAEYVNKWHPHFAVWPVLIKTGEMRWLEVVLRRRVKSTIHYTRWEYKPCS